MEAPNNRPTIPQRRPFEMLKTAPSASGPEVCRVGFTEPF
jgi:hypothetical protein